MRYKLPGNLYHVMTVLAFFERTGTCIIGLYNLNDKPSKNAERALPLFLSIVGASSTSVIFDLAGTVAAFVVIPVMVAQQVSKGASAGDLVRNMVTSPVFDLVMPPVMSVAVDALVSRMKSNLLDLERHTQAAQLIANGVDIKTVQNRLGHASPTLTMSFYAHALPENDRQAAVLIDNLFSQPAQADDEEGGSAQGSILASMHVRSCAAR